VRVGFFFLLSLVYVEKSHKPAEHYALPLSTGMSCSQFAAGADSNNQHKVIIM
jgi:hypothetical protein